jgi:pyruvate-formate lyase-activating enzyme
MLGRIHSLESFGAVDGPGIRYVVFFQGCPLRCIYCHNPDTWPIESGQEMSVEELVDRIRPYHPFLRNGGVTLTGGEPLLQSGFVLELTRALHQEGLHVAIDTAGSIPENLACLLHLFFCRRSVVFQCVVQFPGLPFIASHLMKGQQFHTLHTGKGL